MDAQAVWGARAPHIPHHGAVMGNWEREKWLGTTAGLSAELVGQLLEHSPRLEVSGPTLILHPGSPTGWLVIEPVEDGPGYQ